LNWDEFKYKEDEASRLIDSMLIEIGSVDPELRDQLIYSSFARLILRDHLNHSQMAHILEVCLDPVHLFYKLGETETDSVFTRSFSVLVIALILEKDRQTPFLKKGSVIQAIDASLHYLLYEEDLRGYVKDKGWAHSIAHGADLLAEAIKHPYFPMENATKCLEVIKCCLFKESTEGIPYVDDEGERLVFPIMALIEKGIQEDQMGDWITKIESDLTKLKAKETNRLHYYRVRTNSINLLRGLYFRLSYKKQGEPLAQTIFTLLKKIHEHIYS
jgi:hypothetical protein